MHTFKTDEAIFHYNGDYSGDILITTDNGKLSVSFDSLKSFFAQHVRHEKIAKLEQMSDDDVISL